MDGNISMHLYSDACTHKRMRVRARMRVCMRMCIGIRLHAHVHMDVSKSAIPQHRFRLVQLEEGPKSTILGDTPKTYNKKSLGSRNKILSQDMANDFLLYLLMFSCKMFLTIWAQTLSKD